MRALDQRVAVITGAATGIGRALAGRLAGEGACLALADIHQSGLNEMSQSLTGQGFEVSTYLVDVADARQVEGFARDLARLAGDPGLRASLGAAACVSAGAGVSMFWSVGAGFGPPAADWA